MASLNMLNFAISVSKLEIGGIISVYLFHSFAESKTFFSSVFFVGAAA